MRFVQRIGFPLFPLVSLLAAVAVLPFVSGVIPTVRFLSERIDVHVHPEEVLVNGRYVYQNPHPFPVAQGFSVPFPIDNDHPEPSGVMIERLTPQRAELVQRRLFGKAGFEMFFAAHEEVTVRVSYRQKAGRTAATYILTTTKPWGRPLDDGVYVLHPHGTIIESSNYPLDPSGGMPGFRKTGFMPDRDWQFTWRREDEKEI